MPQTIITLPPELIVKIFRSLDNVATALRLSETCQLMYDVWRSNESVLIKELLPYHPAFWQYPNIEPSDKPSVSLWGNVLEYENARGGKFSLSVHAFLR
jgi:hypothetical protein